MRTTFIILACACLATATAAHAKARKVKGVEGVEAGTRVRIEGVMSLRGSTPFTILVLEIADEHAVAVRADSPDLQQELTNLGGVRVALEGEVLPPTGEALPRVAVDRYEILAPPDAGDPIVGVVSLEKNACVLTTEEGKRYWIVGELAPALSQQAGARVWMVGKKGKRDTAQPPGSTAFTANGYGVIVSAP